MTTARAERLKQLADDLQLLGLFKHNLTQAEAERRIALLGVKLKQKISNRFSQQ